MHSLSGVLKFSDKLMQKHELVTVVVNRDFYL